MLDRTRPYGEVMGNTRARYVQDGIEYDATGAPLEPGAAETPQEEAQEKPRRGRKSRQ